MNRPWIVYGARGEDGHLQYIGITTNLSQRERDHRRTRAWGNVRFSVIRRADSRKEATRIEAALIRRHRPPRNVQHCPVGNREIALPADAARAIWLGNPVQTDWAVLGMMPGWTVARAKAAFGPRPREFHDN
jgi:predicted GIY-YIG superfamily endonuclease